MKKKIIILDDYALSSLNLHEDEKVLLWSAYTNEPEIDSIPSLVEMHGDTLRELYLQALKDFSQLSVLGKSIEDHFLIDEHFSFYWTSQLNQKSYTNSTNIYFIVCLIAFDRWLANLDVSELILYTSNVKLAKGVEFACQEQGVRLTWERQPKKNGATFRGQSIKQRLKKLPEFIKSLCFFPRLFVKYGKFIFIRNTLPSVRSDKKNQMTIVSPFPGIDMNRAKKGDYYSSWWGELHTLLKKSDFSINWVFMYFDNVQCQLDESIRLVKKFKNESKFESFSFLYHFFNVNVFAKVLRYYFRIAFRYVRIKRLLDRQPCQSRHRYVNLICQFLSEEMARSFIGTVALDNLVNFFCFENMVEKMPDASLGLFLMENFGWEKGLVYHWKRVTKSPIIGFVHASIRPFDFRYAGFSDYYQSKQRCCMPSKIAVHGEDAIHNFERLGYPEEYIVLVEAVRFSYLANLKKRPKPQPQGKQITILFLTGSEPDIVEYQCALLRDFVCSYSVQFDIDIIVKPHPLFPSPKIFFTQFLSSLHYRLEFSSLDKLTSTHIDFAFVENSTSAAIEFLYMQLPFCLVKYPHRFNLSSLQRFSELFVETKEDLLHFALNLEDVYHRIGLLLTKYPNLFFLDRTLPCWGMVLDNI